MAAASHLKRARAHSPARAPRRASPTLRLLVSGHTAAGRFATALAFSDDGAELDDARWRAPRPLLAAGLSDGGALVFDVEAAATEASGGASALAAASAPCLVQLRAHTQGAPVVALAWARVPAAALRQHGRLQPSPPPALVLVTAGADGCVRLWCVRTARLLTTLLADERDGGGGGAGFAVPLSVKCCVLWSGDGGCGGELEPAPALPPLLVVAVSSTAGPPTVTVYLCRGDASASAPSPPLLNLELAASLGLELPTLCPGARDNGRDDDECGEAAARDGDSAMAAPAPPTVPPSREAVVQLVWGPGSADAASGGERARTAWPALLLFGATTYGRLAAWRVRARALLGPSSTGRNASLDDGADADGDVRFDGAGAGAGAARAASPGEFMGTPALSVSLCARGAGQGLWDTPTVGAARSLARLDVPRASPGAAAQRLLLVLGHDRSLRAYGEPAGPHALLRAPDPPPPAPASSSSSSSSSSTGPPPEAAPALVACDLQMYHNGAGLAEGRVECEGGWRAVLAACDGATLVGLDPGRATSERMRLAVWTRVCPPGAPPLPVPAQLVQLQAQRQAQEPAQAGEWPSSGAGAMPVPPSPPPVPQPQPQALAYVRRRALLVVPAPRVARRPPLRAHAHSHAHAHGHSRGASASSPASSASAAAAALAASSVTAPACDGPGMCLALSQRWGRPQAQGQGQALVAVACRSGRIAVALLLTPPALPSPAAPAVPAVPRAPSPSAAQRCAPRDAMSWAVWAPFLARGHPEQLANSAFRPPPPQGAATEAAEGKREGGGEERMGAGADAGANTGGAAGDGRSDGDGEDGSGSEGGSGGEREGVYVDVVGPRSAAPLAPYATEVGGWGSDCGGSDGEGEGAGGSGTEDAFATGPGSVTGDAEPGEWGAWEVDASDSGNEDGDDAENEDGDDEGEGARALLDSGPGLGPGVDPARVLLSGFAPALFLASRRRRAPRSWGWDGADSDDAPVQAGAGLSETATATAASSTAARPGARARARSPGPRTLSAPLLASLPAPLREEAVRAGLLLEGLRGVLAVTERDALPALGADGDGDGDSEGEGAGEGAGAGGGPGE